MKEINLVIFKRKTGDFALAIVEGDTVIDWAAFTDEINATAARMLIESFNEAKKLDGVDDERPHLSFKALISEMAAKDLDSEII